VLVVLQLMQPADSEFQLSITLLQKALHHVSAVSLPWDISRQKLHVKWETGQRQHCCHWTWAGSVLGQWQV